MNDPLCRPALEAFFATQSAFYVSEVLGAVRKPIRDTMKEARLAGKAESYEEGFRELARFAEEQLRNANQ